MSDKFEPPQQQDSEWGSSYGIRVRGAERQWQRDHPNASVSERSEAKRSAANVMREAKH